MYNETPTIKQNVALKYSEAAKFLATYNYVFASNLMRFDRHYTPNL